MNMKKLLIILFTGTLFLCNSAWALDIAEAKDRGLVGETPSGYLAAVKSPDDATRNLINDVNAKRKAHYNKSSKSTGTPVSTVEALAGEMAFKKTKPGHFIKSNGKWIKK
jgi:uncharacterized protein YdbL (DUF1318 family)